MPRASTRQVVPVAVLTAVITVVLTAGYAYAQRGGGFFGAARGEQGDPPEFPPDLFPDSNVNACHLLYTSVRAEANGAGWRTDYPWGERHLLMRFSELTKTRVSWLSEGVPHAWLVRLTDDALFRCSYVMASDVGTIGLTPEEAAGLRAYLEKGGFLWVDDFWGEAAWTQWSRELAKALPPSEFPIEDVPFTDAIFHTMFEVEAVPQVPSIRFWRATGGATSERGAESAQARLRAVRDTRGRIVAVMTHNTDISDSFEREGEDPQFFYQFSPNGYAIGINILLYHLTH
ncbi:MAG: DUF4159 domain-containing protein [Vicinamibacterales bacterium]